MAGGYGPPLLDFSPLGNLANTFFDAQDRSRKRKLEDLQLQADGWQAQHVADEIEAGQGAPSAPSAPMPPSAGGSLPAFAAGEGGSPNLDLARFAVGGATRPDGISGFKPEFSTAVSRMIAEAPPEIQEQLKISSGYRSPERQNVLWQQALKKYGSPEIADNWVAPPGRSNHNHGQAADLKYLSPAAKAWVHQNASKYGLAFPLGNEPWHIELASARGGNGTTRQLVAQNGDVVAQVAAAGGNRGAINAAAAATADAPAPGARNAQFQIPGQAPQASAPASGQPPQIKIPPHIIAGLRDPNPFIRKQAGAEAQAYVKAQREAQMKVWEIQAQEESRRRLAQEERNANLPFKERELGQGEERIGIDRERLDWDRNKPMTVSPEQDVIAPDGRVIRAGKQKPNVKTEVINGRVVFIDQDARSASDITPQGLPSGYRPATAEERAAYGIPEGTGARVGPDGKPEAMPGTSNTRVDVNTGQKAGLKYDETISENYAKTFLDIQKSARSAAGAKGTLALMNRLTEDPNFYAGFGAESRLKANKFLSSIGIKDAAANAPNEVFAALGNDLVLNKLGGSLGPGVSNSDTQFLKDTVASLATTVPGNRLLIKFTEKTMDRQQEIGRLAREYAKANGGRIDAGFEDELEAWREQNPLFTEQDFQEARAAMNGPPAGGTSLPVKVSSPDEARKLPKGTKIILPDGSPGVVP